MSAIKKLERVGKYLVKTYDLREDCKLVATEAAQSPNADVRALAVLTVALADIVGAKDDGWVAQIKTTLGYPNL